ncbi:MAG: TfoX/Sxy family protein [Pirellulaceae bacterium]|nr:TfoX/Sxy family protein [Pirellulaceae bacterium]
MGRKGAKLTSQATDVAVQLAERLSPLGDVSTRKMFGGYGIFESKSMFALVTSEGVAHLKVDDSNVDKFVKADAKKFGRMPYYEIPDSVFSNTRSLRSWAKQSIAINKKA